jgi:predicted transcriptional regulator of viral defense system
MVEYELRGSKTKEVFEAIKKAGRPVSLNEIKASTQVNYNTIRSAVQRLAKQGLIKRIGRGIYGV